MTPEARILADIRVALGREEDLTIWRLSQGAGRLASGRWDRFGLVPGAADLIGILAPTGRWFALEVKSPRGRLTEEQRLWGALIQQRGGFWAVVRSVDEAREALERARKGEVK